MILSKKNIIKFVTIAFTLTIIAIIVLADRGTLPEPIGLIYSFNWGDKLGHFILIGLLTFLVNLSLSARKVRVFSKPILLGSLVITIAVVIEEFSQLFFATRSFSLLDLSADFLGIICASFLITGLCHPDLNQTG